MTVIALPAHCDRAAAAALVADLAKAVELGGVTIDGTAVTRIGQVMFQLLVSAQATAAAKGQVMAVTASDFMRETARLMGLESAIFCEERV